MSSFAFVTHNKKLLLMLRDDIPTIPAPNTWALIGGKNEEGETPEETLLREIKEEANLEPSVVKFIWSRPNPHNPGDVQWLYHCPLTDEEIKPLKLGDEGQEIRFISLEELSSLSLSPTMTEMYTKQHDLLEQVLQES